MLLEQQMMDKALLEQQMMDKALLEQQLLRLDPPFIMTATRAHLAALKQSERMADPPLVATPYGLRTSVRMPTTNSNQGDKPTMNFEKITAATDRVNRECAAQTCGEDRARHVADAGLSELFRQTCDQFTAETRAMNVRLAEVEDRANARYDETGAAAVRSRTAADDAKAHAEDAEESAEDANGAANEAAEAEDPYTEERLANQMQTIIEFRGTIDTQAQTIGDMQQCIDGQDAEIAAVNGAIKKKDEHVERLHASNQRLYLRAEKAEKDLDKGKTTITSALQANKNIAEGHAREWDRANKAERDLTAARKTRDDLARQVIGLGADLAGARKQQDDLRREAQTSARTITRLVGVMDNLAYSLNGSITPENFDRARHILRNARNGGL